MINIAAIGTSMITTRFIDAVRMADGLTVTTIYSRDPARAAAFAQQEGIPQTSSDLDELLASEAVDAVYVGSPNSAHHEQVRRAIEAGKHVFVEKPAVPTAGEFAALCEQAATSGVVLFEGMRNVYDPGFDVVRELLPEVGAIRRVAFSYCQRSARYDKVLAGERVNIFDPAMAGGALLDLGVYCVAAMVSLFGEPEHVAAMSVRIASGADGSGVALLQYPGFVGEVEYSKITRSDRPSEIQGETGNAGHRPDRAAHARDADPPRRLRRRPRAGRTGEQHGLRGPAVRGSGRLGQQGRGSHGRGRQRAHRHDAARRRRDHRLAPLLRSLRAVRLDRSISIFEMQSIGYMNCTDAVGP